jgi:hypothetical protein
MGRYAFFSTNFEYKFRFGVQPSDEITLFGGTTSHLHFQQGYLTQTWSQEDRPLIQERLDKLLEWIGEEPVAFEAYEKNVGGSYRLLSELYTLYTTGHSEKNVAQYILGCLIYHQLLYTDTLVADYEP